MDCAVSIGARDPATKGSRRRHRSETNPSSRLCVADLSLRAFRLEAAVRMSDYLFSYADPSDPLLKRSLIRLVEKATGQPTLKRLYVENQRCPRADETFWDAAVRTLALDVRYDPAALAAIPATGPVVVVANHPYGVLDGLVMAWLMG